MKNIKNEFLKRLGTSGTKELIIDKKEINLVDNPSPTFNKSKSNSGKSSKRGSSIDSFSPFSTFNAINTLSANASPTKKNTKPIISFGTMDEMYLSKENNTYSGNKSNFEFKENSESIKGSPRNVINSNRSPKLRYSIIEIYQKNSEKVAEFLNKNKDNVLLLGSGKYSNKQTDFFLEKRQDEYEEIPSPEQSPNKASGIRSPSSSVDLTPIPIVPFKRMKSNQEIKELAEVIRSAVSMRRLEYCSNHNLKRKHSDQFNNILKKPQINTENQSYMLNGIILVQTWWRKTIKYLKEKYAIIIQRNLRAYFSRKKFIEIYSIYTQLRHDINYLENLFNLRIIRFAFDRFKTYNSAVYLKRNLLPVQITKSYTSSELYKISKVQNYFRHFKEYRINFESFKTLRDLKNKNIKYIETPVEVIREVKVERIVEVYIEKPETSIIKSRSRVKPLRATKKVINLQFLIKLMLIQRKLKKLINLKKPIIKRKIINNEPNYFTKDYKCNIYLHKIIILQNITKKFLKNKNMKVYKFLKDTMPASYTKTYHTNYAENNLKLIQNKFKFKFLAHMVEQSPVHSKKKIFIKPLIANSFYTKFIKFKIDIHIPSKITTKTVIKTIQTTKRIPRTSKTKPKLEEYIYFTKDFNHELFKKISLGVQKVSLGYRKTANVRVQNIKKIKIAEKLNEAIGLKEIHYFTKNHKLHEYPITIKRLNPADFTKEYKVKPLQKEKIVKRTKEQRFKLAKPLLKDRIFYTKSFYYNQFKKYFPKVPFEKPLLKINTLITKRVEDSLFKRYFKSPVKSYRQSTHIRTYNIKKVKLAQKIKNMQIVYITKDWTFSNLLKFKKINPVIFTSSYIYKLPHLKASYIQGLFKNLIFRKKIINQIFSSKIKSKPINDPINFKKSFKDTYSDLKAFFIQRFYKNFNFRKQIRDKIIQLKIRTKPKNSPSYFTKSYETNYWNLKLIFLQRKIKNFKIRRNIREEIKKSRATNKYRMNNNKPQLISQQKSDTVFRIIPKISSVFYTKSFDKNYTDYLKIKFLQIKFKNHFFSKKIKKDLDEIKKSLKPNYRKITKAPARYFTKSFDQKYINNLKNKMIEEDKKTPFHSDLGKKIVNDPKESSMQKYRKLSKPPPKYITKSFNQTYIDDLKNKMIKDKNINHLDKNKLDNLKESSTQNYRKLSKALPNSFTKSFNQKYVEDLKRKMIEEDIKSFNDSSKKFVNDEDENMNYLDKNKIKDNSKDSLILKYRQLPKYPPKYFTKSFDQTNYQNNIPKTKTRRLPQLSPVYFTKFFNKQYVRNLKILLIQRKFKNLFLKRKINNEINNNKQKSERKPLTFFKILPVIYTKSFNDELIDKIKIIFIQKRFKNFFFRKKVKKEIKDLKFNSLYPKFYKFTKLHSPLITKDLRDIRAGKIISKALTTDGRKSTRVRVILNYKRIKISEKLKLINFKMIKTFECFDDARTQKSAIDIQRNYRGYLIRKKMFSIITPITSAKKKIDAQKFLNNMKNYEARYFINTLKLNYETMHKYEDKILVKKPLVIK